MEFGSLTDQQSSGRHPIQPWIADELSDAFQDWQCEVVALEIERSFWGKATILHAEYHRPKDTPTPDRFFRHYADTASLAQHPAALAAIDQQELRGRGVTWKSRFFGSSQADYEQAKPVSFRLVPPAARQPPLRRGDEAMRDMYLTESASF